MALEIGQGEDLAVLLRQLRQLGVDGVPLQRGDEVAPRTDGAASHLPARQQAPRDAVAAKPTTRVHRELTGASHQP